MKLQFLVLAVTFYVSVKALTIEPSTSPLELLNKNGYSELKEALVKYNMTNIINSTEPMTIFAPTNDAFKNLRESPWMKNMTQEMMKKMISRLFMLRQKIIPSDMRNEMMLNASSGEKLRLNIYPRLRTINGIIIVMEPKVETHLIIVYRVNRFLMAPMEGRNLFEQISRRKERFSTLTRAIQVANLTETLKKGGPFTVFAPTNEAFKALPEGKLAKLLESPVELKTILLGHIVNGTYFLGGLVHSPDLHTLDGGSNRIVANGTRITVDGARIYMRESMIAENGALHVIDSVLLP